MKITAIKQQVKDADRFSIYIDDKYSLSLNGGQLLDSKIIIGQELSIEEIKSLEQKSQEGKAYAKILNMLSIRMRSKWEIYDYLNRKKYSEQTILKILNMLSKKGYINDEDFARRWIENRRLLKSVSKRKLTQELKQKHIADDIVRQVLLTDHTHDQQVLKKLILQKQKQQRYQDNLKLMRYLAGQGFNYGDIKQVLDDLKHES